jgi:hypothetical protein
MRSPLSAKDPRGERADQILHRGDDLLALCFAEQVQEGRTHAGSRADGGGGNVVGDEPSLVRGELSGALGRVPGREHTRSTWCGMVEGVGEGQLGKLGHGRSSFRML